MTENLPENGSTRTDAPPPDSAPAFLEEVLLGVRSGALSPEAAAAALRRTEVRYVGDFAALDPGRASRKGVPEIVYAPGKTKEQTAEICAALLDSKAGPPQRVVVSGADDPLEALLRERLPEAPVKRLGRALVVGSGESAPSGGRVAALSAGTSDVPVLEEAVAVAREMGAEVRTFNDVGVAGVHRLAEPLERVRSFDPDCLIVAAGMEGALPTLVCALVDVPVVGLPTSTGYGLGGDGTAAILGMLQSCSPGLTVVNVDNGVGAGASAATIANRVARFRERTAAGGRPASESRDERTHVHQDKEQYKDQNYK